MIATEQECLPQLAASASLEFKKSYPWGSLVLDFICGGPGLHWKHWGHTLPGPISRTHSKLTFAVAWSEKYLCGSISSRVQILQANCYSPAVTPQK